MTPAPYVIRFSSCRMTLCGYALDKSCILCYLGGCFTYNAGTICGEKLALPLLSMESQEIWLLLLMKWAIECTLLFCTLTCTLLLKRCRKSYLIIPSISSCLMLFEDESLFQFQLRACQHLWASDVCQFFVS